jgi:predicted nucleotidyltransferase
MAEAPLDRQRIRTLLERRSTPHDLIELVHHALPIRAAGLLLYGSRARGDFGPASDIDLLVLRDAPAGTIVKERVSLSCYTAEQVASATGTLFGMHLARDGVILHDHEGQLRSLLDAMGEPDPAVLFGRIRHLAAVLSLEGEERARYSSGQSRVTRYLLRTAIYATAIAQGKPCFSVRELATRFNDPALATILSSDSETNGGSGGPVVDDLLRRLDEAVGDLAPNTYGSVRTLVVSEWFEDPDRAALGTLVLADTDAPFDYAALPKVLL